jgi:DNA-binding transcriptional LysR family regulator
MRGDIDIRHLRQILAIHAYGSFGRAAADLGVSQPTLSKSIARLEDELGFKLFDRSSEGAIATPAGLFVVERAARICGDMSMLGREMQLLAAGELGEVRIGMGPVITRVLMPALAPVVARAFPALKLRLTVAPRRDLLAGAQTGRLDILIISESDDLDPYALRRFPLAMDHVVVVANPSHPLAGRKAVAASEYARYPGASFGLSAAFAPTSILGLPDADDAVVNAYSSNDVGVILGLAREGLVTAMGMSHIFDEDLRAGALVRLALKVGLELTIIAAMTPAAAESPVLARIVKIAHKVARDVVGRRRAIA